jgi:hypothetical protein
MRFYSSSLSVRAMTHDDDDDNDGPDAGLDDVPETKLARSRFQDDLILSVRGSQLPRDLLCAIWAVVVDDDHLPGELTTLLHNAHISESYSQKKRPEQTHLSLNILASSHTMMGRFSRSL